MFKKTKAIIIVLVIALMGESIYLFNRMYDYYVGQQVEAGTVIVQQQDDETVKEITKEAETMMSEEQQKVTVKPNVKLSENSVGWLSVDGVDISDPVMQYCDNSFYLTHDIYDNYDAWGSYFAMVGNNLSSVASLDRATVIFGHSNGNSLTKKFSVLKHFKDPSFAAQNPYIYLKIGEEISVWQIFAAGDYPIANDYMIANPDDDYFLNEISLMQQYSYSQFTGVDIGTEDKIIILSTCTGNKQYDTRFIVCAKLLA